VERPTGDPRPSQLLDPRAVSVDIDDVASLVRRKVPTLEEYGAGAQAQKSPSTLLHASDVAREASFGERRRFREVRSEKRSTWYQPLKKHRPGTSVEEPWTSASAMHRVQDYGQLGQPLQDLGYDSSRRSAS
jgi:hypothetical protein